MKSMLGKRMSGMWKSCKEPLSRPVALLLAFAVFLIFVLAAPFPGSVARAVTTNAGDINLSVQTLSPLIYLDYTHNFIKDGSDRDSSIPYIYNGGFFIDFGVSSQSKPYTYVTGYAYKVVTLKLNTQVTGLNLNSRPLIRIIDTSLPDDMHVTISNLAGNGNELSFRVNVIFDNADLTFTRRGTITFEMDAWGYADAHDYGASYGQISYSTSVSEDYAGSITMATQITDMSKGAALFYDILSTINSSIVNNLQTLHTDIATTLTNNLKAWFSTNHSDLQTLHTDIATTLTNNLKTWFATNHSDLQTLHTDNTTFLARFNTVYNDLKTRLTTWFNRQHDDLVKLLEETTEGYDNTEGNNVNSDLSSSLGSMESAENKVSDDATANLSGYDPSKVLSFSKDIVSGISFITSMANSFFDASSYFQTIVSVMYTLAFIVIVIGLWRFRGR